MTLVEFLTARLDERERMAKAARDAAPPPWERRYDEDGDDRWMDITASDGTAVIDTETGANGPPIEVAEHFALNDPAWVLADVESKRRIIQLHSTSETSDFEGKSLTITYCPICQNDGECPTLRLLALPDARHPDYLPEWAPQ
jgi:hypothetical protein